MESLYFIVFVRPAKSYIDQFACDMCMSGLVLYTEIIIRSGRPRHRGSARRARCTWRQILGLHENRSTNRPGPWPVPRSATDCMLSACTN